MNILNPRVDAPRELSKLMEIDRTALYILGMHLGIFKGTTDEQAFVTSPPEQQCQRIREELLFRDINGWPDEGQLMPTTPVMPEPEPQPQEQPESNAMMQPPQFPRPVIPSTVGQQPSQQPAQPQLPMMAGGSPMPGYPPPQMGSGPPQMPGSPQQQQQQQQPQFPQAAPMTGMPQMQPPQWGQFPQQAQAQVQPQQAVLPSGRAPAVPADHPSGLGDVLTKIAQVQAANQKLLEAIHKQGASNNTLLHKVLGTLITVTQMQGCPFEILSSSVAQFGDDEHIKAFLQAISGSPTPGKA